MGPRLESRATKMQETMTFYQLRWAGLWMKRREFSGRGKSKQISGSAINLDGLQQIQQVPIQAGNEAIPTGCVDALAVDVGGTPVQIEGARVSSGKDSRGWGGPRRLSFTRACLYKRAAHQLLSQYPRNNPPVAVYW